MLRAVVRSLASLLFVAAVGCKPEYGSTSFVPARPHLTTGVQIDTLVQVANPEVDVLFVIDNSASMSDEQYELGTHFGAFLDPFLGAGFDWHIGVVSTDLFDENQGGRLHPFGDVLWIDPTTEDPEFVFSKLVDVGTAGAAAEAGIGTTWRAIEEHGEGANAGFYRDSAALHAVVVSDEEDTTPEDFLTLDAFESWMLELKAGEAAVSFSSIVNPSGCPCPGAESPGLRYISATNTIGGITWDLHDPYGWPTVLDNLANELTELQDEFFLTRRPVVETLDVHIDDGTYLPVVLGEGVTYDPERNSVVFDLPPPASSEVVIYYEVEE
jgi:hypothetical protein